MIIKKTYAEDDWIVLKLTDLWMLGEYTYLQGVLLDCQDPDNFFEVGETYAIGMTKDIEVISV